MLEDSFTEVYTKFKLHFYQEIFSAFQDQEAGLSAMETFCMEVILALNEPTVNEFASFVRISSPNAAYKINSLLQKGYLENLWPYIENDPELGRDEVLLPPLEAAEVNGGLYMLFQKVRVNTLMGAEHVVGARYGWTFEELMEAFSAMPEDSTILRYNATTRDVFFKLLSFSLARYVNWETGACSFDSEDFYSCIS